MTMVLSNNTLISNNFLFRTKLKIIPSFKKNLNMVLAVDEITVNFLRYYKWYCNYVSKCHSLDVCCCFIGAMSDVCNLLSDGLGKNYVCIFREKDKANIVKCLFLN